MARTRKYKKDKNGNYNTTVRLADGSRKHIHAKTMDELEDKRERYEGKPPDADITLHDYAVRWYAATQIGRRYKTREMYARMVDVYICNPSYGIGGICVVDLRPMQVQEFLTRLKESGSGAHTMQRTCEQALVTLRQIEKSALLDGLIRWPFTGGVSVPKGVRSRRRALTPEEQAAVFAADLPQMEKAALMLLYGCGLRRGELLALRAEDIDLEKKTVSVTKGLVFQINKAVVQDAPKTSSGFRTVPIPESTFAAIRRHAYDVGSGYLFPGRRTPLISQTGWRRMWQRIILAMQMAGADCDGLTPHIFRHNYATKLYYSDLSVLQAADLLGHSDTSMLMQVYAHLDKEKERLAEKIDKAF